MGGGKPAAAGATLSLGLPVSLGPWDREGSYGMIFVAPSTRPALPSMASERNSLLLIPLSRWSGFYATNHRLNDISPGWAVGCLP